MGRAIRGRAAPGRRRGLRQFPDRRGRGSGACGVSGRHLGSPVRDQGPVRSHQPVSPEPEHPAGLDRRAVRGGLDIAAGANGHAISAEGLVKVYRSRKSEVRALDGLDLAVDYGTVLGLLGPNGAGKTTAVRILTTLLRPDAGRATVAGLDVVRAAPALRCQIGLSGQYAAVDDNLTGRENLWLFGRLYPLPSSDPRMRADDLPEP